MKKEIPQYWQDVYDVVRLIPEGKVSTYGIIADYLSLGSARMVGWALNKCHVMEEYIPAHRVVNRKGELSGRKMFSTPTAMAEALLAEGVEVQNGEKIIHFEKYLWRPEEHLF